MTGTLSVQSGWRPGILTWKRECPSMLVSVPSSTSSTRSKNGGSDASSFSFDGEIIVADGPSEFLIECGKGETIFVTSAQSKLLQKRSIEFRELFKSSTPEFAGRVLRRPAWSVAVTRRLVELLTNGTAWIENDSSSFLELQQAARSVSVGLRLGSLINFHDVLDEHATNKFFELINIDNYQFKIRVTIKSWQWIELLKQGILLLLKSKLIMVKTAEGESDTKPLLPPSYDRLAKCDCISSEFCVYANGKVNVLLKILEILKPLPTLKEPVARNQHEMFRITYMARVGSLTKEEMDTLWRITAATYTKAAQGERKYLGAKDPKDSQTGSKISTEPECNAQPSGKPEAKPLLLGAPETTVASGGNKGSPSSTVSSKSPYTDLACRTITCSSFLVLKHVFEFINSDCPGLPATLIINAPTPDTLGRLINASSKCKGKYNELGMDIKENILYATRSSEDIKIMLDYLADYSTSAVVTEDFKLVEFLDTDDKAAKQN